MAIINIFTNQAPQIAGYQFDAVLADTFEASIELTRYPVESGVKVADHRIINPMKYYLTGAIGNNPLKVIDARSFIDIGVSALASVNPLSAMVGGMMASFLAGSQLTRASGTLEFLMNLLIAGQPFDVDAVDIQLQDMVLTKLSRDKTPENETGLIFVAEMQELVSLDRLPTKTQPSQDQLPDNDPAKAAAASDVNLGQQVGREPEEATALAVNVSDGIVKL